MKNYIQRLKNRCPKRYFAFWWILRLLMVYAFISSFFKNPFDLGATVQFGITIVAMFAWEICMAMPEKSFMRLLPASLQHFSSVLLFSAAFFGKFLNLYYDIPWLDAALQFIFGGFAVFVGYEIACALTIRDKYSCTKAMQFWVAFGIGFISMNALELTEFFLDQLVGITTDSVGNAQQWSFALAENTAREKTVIDSIDPERWAIMDTMSDIILNTISAFLALLIINLYPYRLRGKYRYDMEFDRKDAVKVK